MSSTGAERAPSASDVPRVLDVGPRWAWRFVVVCAAIGIIVWLTARLTVVVVPVFVAVILAALLTPLVDVVARRTPRLVATWLVLLGTVAVLGAGAILLGRPISSATSELGDEFSVAIDDLEEWLRTGPLELDQERIDSIFDSVGSVGDRLLSGVTEQPASSARLAAEVVGGIFLTIVLSFFFLKDGRSLWSWMIGLFQPARRRNLDVAGRAAFPLAVTTMLLPLVMRTQVALHPIVILIALGIGGALAGIIGALVSVPVAAAGSAALAAVNGGFQFDESERAPPSPDDG